MFSCSLVMTHLLTHSFVQPGDTGLLCESLCQEQCGIIHIILALSSRDFKTEFHPL